MKESSNKDTFKAIIIGGTGASGKQLLNLLLHNDRCKVVTSVGRRSVAVSQKYDKLDDVVIDSLFDLSSTEDKWFGHDVFFNCIGTTRKRAGSAKEFINIELGISKEAARMASNAKIPHASLISAKGANHKAMAINWIHPFLYMKTMGQKEQTIISDYSFSSVSIFKPGMLIRYKDNLTLIEKLVQKRGVGLNVEILASAMMFDAQKGIFGLNKESHNVYVGNDSIIELIKE